VIVCGVLKSAALKVTEEGLKDTSAGLVVPKSIVTVLVPAGPVLRRTSKLS